MLRVHVAVLGSRTRLRQVDLPGNPEAISAEPLLVCIPRYADLSDLDRQVHELSEDSRLPADLIVLRAHPREAQRLAAQDEGYAADAVDLLHKRSRRPVALLHWADGAHRLNRLAPGDSEAYEDVDGFLEQLRQAELSTYAAEPGVVLPRSSTFHYLGPNGKHYRSFLRAGSALQAPEPLDGAAFWLLPYVGEDTAVVVDSSTISLVALHLGQYLREEDLAPDLSVRLVEPMRGYDHAAADNMIARLTAAMPDVHTRQRALVLVSIASTGGLARLGRTRMRDNLGFVQVRTVALFGPPHDSEPIPHLDDVFCRLPADLDRTEADDCVECRPAVRGLSPALPISPDTYLLGVSQSTVATEISAAAVADVDQLVTRYHDTGAFFAHRDEPPDRRRVRRRHHAIYVDVLRLADSEHFRQETARLARTLRGSVDALLAPDHPAAAAIVDIVQDELELPFVIRDAEDLGKMTPEERKTIDVPRLLIVDDAVITGGRLRGFRLGLLAEKIFPRDLHLFVGLSRPQTEADELAIKNVVHQLGQREVTFHAVERMLLPNWQEDECPWCWERERIAEHGREQGDDVSDRLMDRHQALVATQAGLTVNLFWGLDDGHFPLGPNSVFGDENLSQAEVFAAVASSIQRLRSDGYLDEQFTPPVSKVLVPEFWEVGRFYASPITASILRASRRHDLLAPVPGKRFIAAADARLREHASRNQRPEFLLALAAGKIPPTMGALDALTSEDMDPGMFSLFNRLLPNLAAEAE
jgi:hypothetical protein